MHCEWGKQRGDARGSRQWCGRKGRRKVHTRGEKDGQWSDRVSSGQGPTDAPQRRGDCNSSGEKVVAKGFNKDTMEVRWLREKTSDGQTRGEPEEVPPGPGCGTERERRAEAHQCDHVPCTLEQSRKIVAGIGGGDEVWSMAHRRPKRENARPSARRRASPTPSSQWTAGPGDARGHPRRCRRSARLNWCRAEESSPMNARQKQALERA